VLAQLNQTLAWYQEARSVMRSVNEAGGLFFGREDEQTVLRVLQRAFDVARAQAEVLAHSSSGSSPTRSGVNLEAQRARIEADVKRDEEALAALGRRPRARGRSAAGVEADETTLRNRLALNRMRLDFIVSMGKLSSATQSVDSDLAHRIQALQDAVPELAPNGAAAQPAPAVSPIAAAGSWSILRRLITLQGGRSSLDHLSQSTDAVLKSVDAELATVQSTMRPIIRRLRALAEPPSSDATPASSDVAPSNGRPTPQELAEREGEFRVLLDRGKLLGPVVVPLRGQSALLRRYAGDLQDSRRFVDRASIEALESLGLQLLGLALAIAGILVGAALWRVAAVRYLTNPYHRRLAITTRNVVAGCAIGLVVLFHFTSELTALVTALGFAAAGIAFALQNVILSVAGYFSMVAPHGIRVGDRVSLQGPFGYVHGEVLEIGLVRIRLLELGGDEDLKPTGRVAVFPNSVVFTGSFYKGEPSSHPPAHPAT